MKVASDHHLVTEPTKAPVDVGTDASAIAAAFGAVFAQVLSRVEPSAPDAADAQAGDTGEPAAATREPAAPAATNDRAPEVADLGPSAVGTTAGRVSAADNMPGVAPGTTAVVDTATNGGAANTPPDTVASTSTDTAPIASTSTDTAPIASTSTDTAPIASTSTDTAARIPPAPIASTSTDAAAADAPDLPTNPTRSGTEVTPESAAMGSAEPGRNAQPVDLPRHSDPVAVVPGSEVTPDLGTGIDPGRRSASVTTAPAPETPPVMPAVDSAVGPQPSRTGAAQDAAGNPTPASTHSPETPSPTAQLVSVLAPLRARSNGSTHLTLSLRPDDLGQVDVEFRIERGTVHLALRAEQAGTATLLRENLSDLRGQLQEHGITTGDMSVGEHDHREEAHRDEIPEVDHRTDDETAVPAIDPLTTDADALVDVRM